VSTGADIVKDELTKRIKEIQASMSPEAKKAALREINTMWKASNVRRFDGEEYAKKDGSITKWDKFKDSTLKYQTKKGTVWRRRASAYRNYDGSKKAKPGRARYSSSSKLLKDTGRLRLSVGLNGAGQIIDTTSKYTELGTRVKYAAYQHSMRPVVSISARDRLIFLRHLARKFKIARY